MISSLHRCEASDTEAQSGASLSLHNKSKWYSLVPFPEKLESDVDRFSTAGIGVQTLLVLLRLDCDLILLTSICNNKIFVIDSFVCICFSPPFLDVFERQMD